ncbi:MAG: SpoIID/LytB domain-containing protein [Gemmatimonadaceae bacterium]|nr:SpoIID/LytB domain-containing protein [Gemmatimonadaceae bacterium]
MTPPALLRRATSGASILALSLAAACARDTITAPAAPSTTSGISAAVSAAAPAGYIRIGVIQAASQTSIGGTGTYDVTDAATGAVLLSGSASEAKVTLVSVSVKIIYWRVQVQCSGNLPYVNDWTVRVAAAGYDPYTEYVAAAKCWRMRVGRFPTRTDALGAQPELYRLGLAPAASGGAASQVTEFVGVTKYQATSGSAVAQTTNPIRVVPTSGDLTIDGDPYRGVGEVRLNSAGTLTAVNELPIEDYLLGVVPRELGPIAFPYLEALKAQAVAARTYAYANLGKRRNDGYDLTATTSDQVYGGKGAEYPLSSQAVTETAGVVATYQGKLIEALYSSTTGGFTANSEDVYNSAPVPYLRGVPDAQRGQAFEHVPSLDVFRNHSNPISLRNASEGDFEADWSKYHRWYVDWSKAEMAAVVANYFKVDPGEVLEVNVVDRSGSGRALTLQFVTTNGTFAETKDRIRSALKFYNSSNALTSLYSTLFYIQPVVDRKTKTVTGWEAWGGGWGHGVGLSQTGAVGMAEKGASYDEILHHYYQGIELELR